MPPGGTSRDQDRCGHPHVPPCESRSKLWACGRPGGVASGQQPRPAHLAADADWPEGSRGGPAVALSPVICIKHLPQALSAPRLPTCSAPTRRPRARPGKVGSPARTRRRPAPARAASARARLRARHRQAGSRRHRKLRCCWPLPGTGYPGAHCAQQACTARTRTWARWPGSSDPSCPPRERERGKHDAPGVWPHLGLRTPARRRSVLPARRWSPNAHPTRNAG